MRLANASTHVRYVMIAETLETPAAALPNLVLAPAVPKLPANTPTPQTGNGALTRVGAPPFHFVGQPGLEPGANGLRVRCSTN